VNRKKHLRGPEFSIRRSMLTLSDGTGSQIVEFALSLPLLVVFVVGIFDFGGAVTFKQRLTNAAREGARIAASDPANDVTSVGLSTTSLPASVSDAYQVVDNYLLSENINDCGLSNTSNQPQYLSGLTWVSTVPCSHTTNLVLTINRGWVVTQTIGGNTVKIVTTQVTIQYPYQWEYSKVASLVGSSFTGPTSITTTATAYNEN
jgi:Flp pilus assembly protein TadG